MTVTALLVVIAFGLVIGSAAGKVPLWISVFLLSFLHLLSVLPR